MNQEDELSDKELEEIVAGKNPLSIVSLGVSAASVANKIVQERKKERQSRSLLNTGNRNG